MPRTIRRPDSRAENPTPLRMWLTEFLGLDKNIKELTKRKEEIKARLAGAVEDDGEEDDKGHQWLDLGEAVGEVGRLKRERRVSQVADEEKIEEILKAKGLNERCYTMVPMLDTDEVMAAHYEGLISEDEIDEMFPKKITFAFLPVKGS